MSSSIVWFECAIVVYFMKMGFKKCFPEEDSSVAYGEHCSSLVDFTPPSCVECCTPSNCCGKRDSPGLLSNFLTIEANEFFVLMGMLK